MKYIKEYLETVVKIKPLGELATKEDELNDLSGEMVYIDGKCSDIFISHADYANWLESKYEQKKCCGEVNDIAMQQQLQIWFDKGKCSGRDEVIFHPENYGLQKQGEHKPADKVKPKFRVGDWLASDYNNVAYIESISETKYNLQCKDGYHEKISIDYIDRCWHLWTIQDAKDGDILVSQHNQPFIYNGNYNDYRVGAYCGIEYTGEQFVDTYAEICWTDNESINPATKEQRDLLFQKMHESGYTFDFEKKELKKLKFKVGDEVITENEESLTITRIDKEGYWSNDLFICNFDNECIWDLVEQKPVEWRQENREELTEFENAMMHIGGSFFGENAGLDPNDTNVIKEQANLLLELIPNKENIQSQINVTDEELAQAKKDAYNDTLDKIEYHDDWPTFDDGWNAAIDYIRKKSIRFQEHWRPSDEQIEVLESLIENRSIQRRHLVSLYEQLKKLKGE